MRLPARAAVPQRGVDQAIVLPVGVGVGLGGPLERELVGAQDAEGQLAGEPPCHLGPAASVPSGGEGRWEGGDLGAADGQPPAVERGAQGESGRPGAVPGADQRGSLVRQQPQGGGEALGAPTGLDHEVGSPPSSSFGHGVGDLVRGQASHPEGAGGGPPGRQRLRAEDLCPGPGQQHGDKGADRAQADHHGDLSQAGPGIKADLESRLDQGIQGGGARIQPVDGNRLAGVDDEPVLMGVEGEDELALGEGPCGLDDPADRAVAVAERIGERAGHGAEGFVQGEVGIDLAPVGEQLGPARDPGPFGGHQDTSLGRRREVHLPHLDPSGSHEVDRAGLHQGHRPALRGRPSTHGRWRMRPCYPTRSWTKRFRCRQAGDS